MTGHAFLLSLPKPIRTAVVARPINDPSVLIFRGLSTGAMAALHSKALDHGLGDHVSAFAELTVTGFTSELPKIKPGSKVTIYVANGMGRDGIEWKEKTGRAVMLGPAGWVLNMGGKYGTPGVATDENIVRVK